MDMISSRHISMSTGISWAADSIAGIDGDKMLRNEPKVTDVR